MTLTPGFTLPLEAFDDAPDTAQRHQILDAEWVAGGRGIMVLLENRQWGIWDRYDTSDKSFDFTGYLKWSRAGYVLNWHAPFCDRYRESSGDSPG